MAVIPWKFLGKIKLLSLARFMTIVLDTFSKKNKRVFNFMDCCNNCLTVGVFGNCSKCGCAKYCSRSCQRLDWKNHKPFCLHFSGKSKNDYLTSHFVKTWRNQWKRYVLHLLHCFPQLPADLMSKISQLPPNIDKIVLKITEIVSNALGPMDANGKECDRLPSTALLLRAKKSKRLSPVCVNNLNPDDDSCEKLLYKYRNNDKNTGTRLYFAPFSELSFSIAFLCLTNTDDEYYCQWTKDFGFAGSVLMFATYHDEDGQRSANTSLPLDQSILDDDCMLLLGILARLYLEGETSTCCECDLYQWKTHLFGANRHTVSPKNHCHTCHDLVIRDDDHPLWKCGKCKNIYYCSKECQKTDWPNHIDSCTVKSY